MKNKVKDFVLSELSSDDRFNCILHITTNNLSDLNLYTCFSNVILYGFNVLEDYVCADGRFNKLNNLQR